MKEIERAVLACAFLDPDLVAEVAALQPADFMDPSNRMIQAAIHKSSQAGEPIDEVLIGKAIGSYADVAELTVDLPDVSRFHSYLRELREDRQRRELFTVCRNALDSLQNGSGTPEDLLGILRYRFEEIEALEGVKAVGSLATSLPHVLGNLGFGRQGIETGYPGLDFYLRPDRGELVIGAGRPGHGKSVWLLGMARHLVFVKGGVAAIFSLEMTKEEWVQRLLSAESNVPFRAIRRGQLSPYEMQELRSVQTRHQKTMANLLIDDDAGVRVEEIAARAKKIQRQVGRLDLIGVDYLQLIESPKAENRNAEITKISRRLKLMAKDLNVPVVALSQLSRESERRSDPRPQLVDLRDSGAIEQDADAVVFIYRPTVRVDGNDVLSEDGELIVRKHRNGECGATPFKAKLNVMRLESIEERYS